MSDDRKVFGEDGLDVYFETLRSRERLPTLKEISDLVLLVFRLKKNVDPSVIKGVILAHDPLSCIAFLEESHSEAVKVKDTELELFAAEIERLKVEIKRLSDAVELADMNQRYMEELISQLEASRSEAQEHTQRLILSSTESDESTTDGESGGGGSTTDGDTASRKRGRGEGGLKSASTLKRSNASAH